VPVVPADPDRAVTRLIVWTDGASRSNPGPAGIGVSITTPEGEVVGEIAQGLGIATNNVAEYTAAIEGLAMARDLGATEVILRSDSRLLIEQLAGRFRVKNPTLQKLHREARARLASFERFRLEHVRRELNKEADRLANAGVDEWLAVHPGDRTATRSTPSLFDDEA
jgi:ribonuclease HI